MLGIEFGLPEVDWTWASRAALAHFALGFWVILIVVWIFTLVTRPKWFNTGFTSLLKLAFWGGVFSNLSDLDHISMFFGRENGRLLHTPLSYFGGLVIALFLVFNIGTSRRRCDRPGCPEPRCVTDTAVNKWRQRFGFAALMSVAVIVHVLEDYYHGAF